MTEVVRRGDVELNIPPKLHTHAFSPTRTYVLPPPSHNFLNPKPYKPYTLNPKPYTLNPTP